MLAGGQPVCQDWRSLRGCDTRFGEARSEVHMRRSAQRSLPSVVTSVDEVARFERFVRLTRPDRTRGRPRVYMLRWETPLFSEHTLVRTYGPQGTEGRTISRSYPDPESARRDITRLLHRRLRRGYQI